MADDLGRDTDRLDPKRAYCERLIIRLGWDEFRAQVARRVRRHRTRKLLGDRRREAEG
jgi:hypothetical protein